MEDDPLLSFSTNPSSSQTLYAQEKPPLRTAPLTQPLSHQTTVLLRMVTEALHNITADGFPNFCLWFCNILHPLQSACSAKSCSWLMTFSDLQEEARSVGCYEA